MAEARIDRLLRWIERGFVALGSACLIWVGAISMHAVTYQAQQSTRLARLVPASDHLVADRDRKVRVAPLHEAAVPIGRLEIPRIGLSAVVMEGDDENTLKVAVGHLSDTPLPWQDGNAVLAGHRDTFFRSLRRVRTGDEIRLVTPRGTLLYQVTGQVVVKPNELWVLDPSPATALTLITCYPFTFVGPAPRRFVIHAERTMERSDSPQTAARHQGGGVP